MGREVEVDYLVVGAGAMGMGFTDALIDHAGRLIARNGQGWRAILEADGRSIRPPVAVSPAARGNRPSCSRQRLVPQARVELATFRLGGGCSIH